MRFSAYIDISDIPPTTSQNISFPFGEEKLVAPLIAIPNVDIVERIEDKGKAKAKLATTCD